MGYEIISDMTNRAEQLRAEVRAAKTAQGKSNQALAEETGIGKSSVDKLLAGNIGSPGLIQVAAICKVLGLSIDTAMGLREGGTKPGGSAELLAEKDRAIELLQEHSMILVGELAEVRRSYKPLVYGLCGLCILLAAVWGVYVVLDAQRPDAGLIQGKAVSPVVWIGAAAVVALLAMLLHLVVSRWYRTNK